QFLDREGDRVDLLDELGSEPLAQRRRARPRHEHAPLVLRRGRERRLDRLEQLEHLLGLLGLVPLVIAPQDLERPRIEDDGLDGRRAHVDSDDDGFGSVPAHALYPPLLAPPIDPALHRGSTEAGVTDWPVTVTMGSTPERREAITEHERACATAPTL